MMSDRGEKKLPPTTAHVLAVFAGELRNEGFTEEQVTALLVVALQHELKQENGLMILDV